MLAVSGTLPVWSAILLRKTASTQKPFTGSYDADPFENFILNGSFPEDQDKFFEVSRN
jgi:hypothetical protein